MGARGVGLSLTLRLAASSSNLPTRGADVQPPAAVYVKEPPAFSVYTRRSGRAGREGNWAPGPRRGGQAAAPRTQAAPSPKHTRTHARARRPIGSHGAVGRRSHRSPFIPPKARFPGPGRLQPAFPGGSRGPPRGSVAPRPAPHPPTATASSPRVYAAPQTRAPSRSPPSPPAPRCPATPPRHSDLPRRARRSQAGRGRRAAAGSAGNSRVSPPPEPRPRAGSEQRADGGGREGAESKSSGRSGPSRAPVSKKKKNPPLIFL